jgi:hypothetical protein
MLAKIATRKGNGTHNQEHRDKISAAIKLKWQDEEYRKKTQASIARRAALNANPKKQQNVKPLTSTRSPSVVRDQPTAPTLMARSDAVRAVQPRTLPRENSKSNHQQKAKEKKPGEALPVARASIPRQPVTPVARASKPRQPVKPVARASEPRQPVKSIKKDTPLGKMGDNSISDDDDEPLWLNDKRKQGNSVAHGSVDLLKRERRDLYDLLYGDEEVAVPSDDIPTSALKTKGTSSLASVFALEDDNLDTFDPYGLEDF